MDSVSDTFGASRRFRILAVNDDCCRENLGLIADTSISGDRVTRELDALVRLYGRPASIVTDNGTEFTSKAVLKWAKDNGVECVGSISLMFAGRDLIHADPGVRADSVEYLKGAITMIKALRDGASEPGTMSIVPSEVGKVKEMASPEEEWAWAVEGLKEVNEYAKGEGVRIAVEALNRFETNFINRHDQALLLAQEVGDEVGVCLDVYHMNQEEADDIAGRKLASIQDSADFA